MTSQPQPAAGEGRSLGQYLRPLRDLAAWALVGVPAVLLFVAIIRLIPGGDGEQFASRTQDSFYAFVNLATIFFPLAAVLLALVVQPPHPQAKVITVLAAVEYAVAAFFGVVFGILVGLIQIAGFSVRTAFEELLVRAAWLAVFGLAGFAVYRIWRGLFHVPKPAVQPGMYGQPQYGVPGTYPGQPGYGPPGYPQPGAQFSQSQPGAQFSQPQPGAQFSQPQPGQPQSGQAQTGPQFSGFQSGPPQAGQFQPGRPQPSGNQPVYGGQPPVPPPGWGQQPPAATQPVPSPGHAATQPVSAAPSPGPAATQPVSAQPAGAPGTPPGPAYPSGALSDPTQVVPLPEATGSDRTEVVRDDRPGYGAADQDPPRR